jgi:tRNA G18 (ribose-2'-O)-methylase SpoU
MTPDPGAETMAGFCAGPRPERLALVVGTEGAGLTPATLARVDRRVRIPMPGAVDSLNLAVATGIVLSRLRD